MHERLEHDALAHEKFARENVECKRFVVERQEGSGGWPIDQVAWTN